MKYCDENILCISAMVCTIRSPTASPLWAGNGLTCRCNSVPASENSAPANFVPPRSKAMTARFIVLFLLNAFQQHLLYLIFGIKKNQVCLRSGFNTAQICRTDQLGGI